MRKHALAATALTIAATGAHAGGIMRDGDRSQVLFEEGKNYLEFSTATVNPNVSGTVAGVLGSGNIQSSYQNYALSYKHQVNDKFAFAITGNEPYGANVTYVAGTPYPFSGSSAVLDTFAVTGLAKYNFSERVSAYGGVRIQALSGNLQIRTAGLPLPAVYNLQRDRDWQTGYVLGAAYQIPDIAMKVAITYESEIEHEFVDSLGLPFDVTIPQAVTLHAQSGIAKDTLLFGSIRWQEWTEFEIRPMDFLGGAVAIASEPSDIWTYEVGIGRKFTDHWSGAFTIGYEEDQGDVVGNLSGRDGYTSFGVAVKYETENWEITSGVRYIDVGSARTSIGANFTDNDAIAAGIKVGLRF